MAKAAPLGIPHITIRGDQGEVWGMNIRRAGRLLVSLVVLTSGWLVAVSSPQANAAPAGCTLSNLCIWVNILYDDGPGKFAVDEPDWNNFDHNSCSYNATWNNCVSSAYNDGDTGDGVYLYETINYNDGRYCLPQFVGVQKFELHQFGNGDNLNDRVSANKWSSACG